LIAPVANDEALRPRARGDAATPGAGRWYAAACVVMLAACAGYDGRNLQPGKSTRQDVVAAMGEPAAQWTAPDRSEQLSFPRGPAGYHSYMVDLDADGRLQDIRDVMGEVHFRRISPGMTESDVLRAIGPPVPAWTSYFPARRERVWEWRYCNEFNEAARFDVLFDGDRHDVRSTLRQVEVCGLGPCSCGR
jgi:hypothetical protein